MNLPNIIHYAIPFFILTVALEAFFAQRYGQLRFEKKDSITSLAMGLGSVLIGLFSKPFFDYLILDFFHQQFAIYSMDMTQFWPWFVLVIGEDFSYYCFHAISHKSRFFWAAHVNHHSSQLYNLSTALRQTWTGAPGIIFYIPLTLVGFHPAYIFFQKGISLLYQYWIHTEAIKNMGFFESVFNTPSHHRVHHGRNIKYLDKNHGGILIIWDKLFGTFQKEEEKPEYGLTKNIESFNLITVAFHEWIAIWNDIKNSPSISIALKYIFLAPGWSHDRSRKTTKELQLELKNV